jgi:hypothetical protein
VKDVIFVIEGSEDGGMVRSMTPEQFTKELEAELEDNGGEMPEYFEKAEDFDPDTNYWGYTKLVIRGHVVVPKAKATVTRVELPE